MTPVLAELTVGARAEAWEEAGFGVEAGGASAASAPAKAGGVVRVGGIAVRLVGEGEGLLGWGLRDLPAGADLDGLRTAHVDEPPAADADHPNGAIAVDHVVVFTPDLERTIAAFATADLQPRRIRKAGGGVRQAFFVLKTAVAEIAGPHGPEGPASFWGAVFVTKDIDETAAQLGGRLGQIKPAVQPWRRIATVRSEAGLGLPVAFLTPR